MSLATATLDRFTTITSALTGPLTETPVTRNPTDVEARDYVRQQNDYMLYVTGEDGTNVRPVPQLVGTVVRVTPSGQRNGWLYRDPATGGMSRVYGAPLNRGMENGHYYRSLSGSGVLARYNDGNHVGARNIASLPLSILAANGVTWPVPGDGTVEWTDTTPYIEVEAPGAVDALSAPAEAVDVHQFVEDTGVDGPTRGFAEKDEQGRVALNPALEVGGTYLYWVAGGNWDNDRITEVRMVRAITDGAPEFAHLGYWMMARRSGEYTPDWNSARSTALGGGELAWAKLALTDPVPDPTRAEDIVRRWNEALTTEAAAFATFNEATNELAKENDWCSEYEGIVEPLGMEGRSKTVHDYDVEVSASIAFEADSVSSRIDSHVATDYDIPGISLNSATFRGDVTVTIRVSDMEDSDDASDSIDRDTVEEHINNLMSGIDNLEIENYEIGTITEVDD